MVFLYCFIIICTFALYLLGALSGLAAGGLMAFAVLLLCVRGFQVFRQTMDLNFIKSTYETDSVIQAISQEGVNAMPGEPVDLIYQHQMGISIRCGGRECVIPFNSILSIVLVSAKDLLLSNDEEIADFIPDIQEVNLTYVRTVVRAKLGYGQAKVILLALDPGAIKDFLSMDASLDLDMDEMPETQEGTQEEGPAKTQEGGPDKNQGESADKTQGEGADSNKEETKAGAPAESVQVPAPDPAEDTPKPGLDKAPSPERTKLLGGKERAKTWVIGSEYEKPSYMLTNAVISSDFLVLVSTQSEGTLENFIDHPEIRKVSMIYHKTL